MSRPFRATAIRAGATAVATALTLFAALALLATSLAPAPAGAASDPVTLTLVTHDSFAVAKPVLRAFEREHHVKVKVLAQGGGRGPQPGDPHRRPLGDVFGVDNTFSASRRGHSPNCLLRLERARRVPARHDEAPDPDRPATCASTTTSSGSPTTTSPCRDASTSDQTWYKAGSRRDQRRARRPGSCSPPCRVTGPTLELL
jgi:hypothetical protein